MNVIIDYDAGNITSLCNALEKLKVPFQVSSDPEVIQSAKRVLFPGQGNIAQAKKNLEEKGLVQVIQNLDQPFLGICVGMQLLYESSEEGDTSGLGILPGKVKRFLDPELKVPQMGWNTIQSERDSKLLLEINHQYFYFVHSYAAPINQYTLASAEYGKPFTAVCQRDNFYGTQFHPEKSGEAGLRLLQNFLTL